MPLPRPARRLIMPVTLLVEAALLLLSVAVAVVGILSWVVDRRIRLARLGLMAAAYIMVEWAGLAALLGVWVASPLRGAAATQESNVSVLGWALTKILAAARRTVHFETVLPESTPVTALDDPEPLLVLARHGGIGDSYALVWLLCAVYRRRPRVVLKSVLLWEPLLDVALSRLDGCFLPRSARSESDRESLISATASSLQPGDALLLFPEGGNWTPRRHRKAIGRLREARLFEAAHKAALMDNVLPPRPGGVLACLDARPELPVVVVAHSGLEKITSAALLWAGIPFSAPMTIRWWPPPSAPADREERLAWLTTEWAIVDQWIAAQQANPGDRGPALP